MNCFEMTCRTYDHKSDKLIAIKEKLEMSEKETVGDVIKEFLWKNLT